MFPSAMFLLWPMLVFLAVFGSVAATEVAAKDLVTWDKFSLKINGTRVFIQSAEFHYQRLPVPDLWTDVFQKIKANGFNAVSIYFFWSYHSALPGVFDFESPGKDVQRLLDAAKEAGLWVIARPGPYCNAETNGGGLALWGSDGSMGELRTSDDAYHKAWLPWISAIGKIIAKNQITNGGGSFGPDLLTKQPVILYQVENELQETQHSANNTLVVYMEQLEAAFHDAGMVVPSTSNEKGMRSISWSTDYQNVGGAVDVYGLDSYPGGLECTDPDVGFSVVRTYHQWFQTAAPTQPVSLPEFEGGWFSAWGATGFYDQCSTELSPEFADVYYKNNLGQRTTSQNIYMTFGGTNWGHSAAPVVYTSYDYSAPLSETRQQTTKLFQTKLVNLFATTSPALLKTEVVGNGTGFHLSSTALFSWVLRNPDTGTTFTVIQQTTTPSRDNVSASVTLNTSAGAVVVPNVELYGRQSKILVTDYMLGDGSQNRSLLYASPDVATTGTFGDQDVLVFYLREGQTGEFAFRDSRSSHSLTYQVYGRSKVASSTSSSTSAIQKFTYVQGSGTTAVLFSNNVLVYLLDQPAAWRFWAPHSGETVAQTDAKDRLFVLGPYLVRSASVDWTKRILHIQGDSDGATTIEAFVGSGSDSRSGKSSTIQTIEWNGKAFAATKTAYGAYRANISGGGSDQLARVKLPSMEPGAVQWYTADGLPERLSDYDDTRWTVCNKTTTSSPVAPLTLPVLFSSDYGFYAGAKIYRGRFGSGSNSTGKPTAVNITASGGLGFGWTAWLNGHLLGGQIGNATQTTSSALLAIPETVLAQQNSSSNVLTVLVDYHGHDETSTAHGLNNPRGLLGAELMYNQDGGDDADAHGFTSWKLAGPAGGGASTARILDPIRGPMNEGGLHAERLGWHLPGFDVAGDPAFAKTSSPFDGLDTAGVRFYVATFPSLNIPAGLDVPLGIELSAVAATNGSESAPVAARVQLWINGYQYGKYVSHLGPQTRFPVPPGILNVGRGKSTTTKNTLAISLWAMTDAGAKLDRVAVVNYGGAYETSLSVGDELAAQLQPRWTDRSEYA